MGQEVDQRSCRNLDEVERIRSSIQEQEEAAQEFTKTCDKNKEIVESVCNNLRLLYSSLRSKTIEQNDPHLILGSLAKALSALVVEYEERLAAEDEEAEVISSPLYLELLPNLYCRWSSWRLMKINGFHLPTMV